MRGATYGLRPCRVRKIFWQLKRHSTETERHMGRSLQASSSGKFYFQEDFIFAGAQSAGSAPHSILFRPPTNLNHFYPVAGARRKPSQSRWTGLGAEQPEFVAHKRLQKKQYNKNQGGNPPWLKFLKVLRKLLSRSFLSGAWGKAPRSSLFLPRPVER